MSSSLSILTLLVACNGDDVEPDDTHSGETGTTGTPQDDDGDSYFDCSSMLDYAYGALCNGKAADCDDNNAAVFPGASEFCDGEDNNCDGNVDEESAVDVTEWCADADSDSFGDPAVTAWACESPNGYVDNPDDCDDDDAAVNPNQSEESYNGVDDDCDESTLDDDLDGDGYGTMASDDEAVSGFDCDDADSTINPSAEEICDDIDNNCDTQIDEGVTTKFYADVDGDLFGDESDSAELCAADGIYTTEDASDCDDEDAAVYPAATETCNGVDDDCDDVEDDGLTENTFYADADSDGFGDEDSPIATCESSVTGYVADATDCDDTNAAINTDGYDVCEDGVDQDCNGVDETCVVTATDADGDGDDDVAFGGGDCDDTDAAINSRATELCDSVDNNCDGTVDEDDAADAATWYEDSDSDGYGNSSSTTAACSQPTGYTSDNTDCDDTTSSVSPAATETAYDGVDNDCSTSTPDDDIDGDGYNLADDCDDEDAAISPAGYDVCEDGVDQDCSGTDETCVVTASDADGDGEDDTTDCDDSDPAVNSYATEICDGLDNDCDGDVDDDDSSVADQTTWYRDADSDNYGDSSATGVEACEGVSGYVADNTDFNDASAAAYPGATEVCDEIDNDGDSSTDEGVTTTYYADSDGDSYGNASDSAALCAATAAYSTTDATDCDDTSASVNPAASETCNSTDDNCDGDTDEGVTTTYYADGDSDGFGTSDTTDEACSQPTGFVTDATDCDDTTAAVNPAATEECNGEDDNCNGLADDDDSGLDLSTAVTWYVDSDSDGYGDATGTPVQFCEQPAGHVADDTDCDDGNLSINPGATEICDTGSDDEDCDGLVDDTDSSATGQTTRYYDGDTDGYGTTASESVCDHNTGYSATNSTDCDDSNASYYQNLTGYADSDGDGYTVTSSSTVCSGASILTGYSTSATTADCDDATSSVNPGATETCNSTDDDCDGTTDEGVTTTYYADGDGDGYGVEASTTEACSVPSGYAAVTTPFDCDDSDTSIPAASEDPDFIGDEDCDGQGIGNLSDYDNVFDGITYDYMGFSMANVGDMTGDGVPDTLVGAPGWTGSAAYGYGYAFLLPGSATSGWNTAAYTYIEGESSGDHLATVASAGDLDADGVNDILVGADYRSTRRGSAYLVTGLVTTDSSLASADYEWTGDATYDQTASDLWSAGDFNGDGYDDILIGAYHNSDGGTDAGQAYIELGPVTAGGTTSLSSGADITITGASTGDYLGTSIASADFDGDGYSDVVLGAQHAGSTGEGEVYVFAGSGSPSTSMTPTDADATHTGSMTSGEAGSSLFASDEADIDGDGSPDLVIGERYNNCNGTASGSIYVVNNPLTSTTLSSASVLAYICGEYNSELGDSSYAIDAADQDGDGDVDLLLGAQLHSEAYLFRGPVSGTLDISNDPAHIFEGESTGAYAGRSAKFLGDIDSDGYLEIGVGDPGNTAGGGKSGSVYIISGDRLQ